VSNRLPWALIWAACFSSFAATSSGTTRAPFLLDMARDLDVGMPMVANLVSLTSIAWGITSAAGGILSDRIGRRALLVISPFGLAITLTFQAAAESFTTLAVWTTLGGAFCGAFMGVLMAEVASHVEDRQRGRALGWVMSGQSLTLVVGVPMAAAVGSLIGWRGWLDCVAVLAALAALSLFATVPRSPSRPLAAAKTSLRGALTPQVLGLLGTGIAERICYGLAAVYYATFLQVTYKLDLIELALPLAVFAIGNIVGTVLGGQLADRFYDRLLTFAIAMAASGVSALALFLWHPNPETSVALGFLYVLINALGRPALMATYAAVPERVRGTVMGLSGAAASVGWLGAAALGAVMISLADDGGFEGFGPLALVLSLLGAAGAMWCRRRVLR
jgi:predicted MFS family arabinose efflux permease